VPSGSKVAKIFIEGCTHSTIALSAEIVTGTVEVWRCTNTLIRFLAGRRVGTVQADMCDSVDLDFPSVSHMGSIVHADSWGPLRLSFSGGDTRSLEEVEGQQSITRLVGGGIITEKIIRGPDEYPTTERESPALRTDPSSKAEARKDQGNEAFKRKDYAQAVAHYTSALEHDPNCHTALANRSACFLKTGRHEEALNDAEECTAKAPGYAKGHFRRGMSLHALGRYDEAVPCFLKVLDIEPNNKQAKDALGMSQLMHKRRGSKNSSEDGPPLL